MCGIVGVYSYGNPGLPLEADTLARMRDTMAHRGPDDAGVFVSPNGMLGLGHRRLSILDLSSLGHQPMSTPDGRYWIVFNGEIYNFRELRPDLETKGYTFRSASDTEVLLALFAEYGPDMLHRLRGMFALAIWDAREERLWLARDRIGIKPLYYTCQGGRFLFASEIKAILAFPGIPRAVHLPVSPLPLVLDDTCAADPLRGDPQASGWPYADRGAEWGASGRTSGGMSSRTSAPRPLRMKQHWRSGFWICCGSPSATG